MTRFKYDANGVKPADFSLLPPGSYHVAIVDYKEKFTRNNDTMIRVECEVDEPGPMQDKKIWHNVSFLPKDRPGAGIAVHFLKTIGEPWQGAFEVNTDNWIGKRFLARVIVSKNPNNDKDQNEIAGLLPVTDGITVNVKRKAEYESNKKANEGVPF